MSDFYDRERQFGIERFDREERKRRLRDKYYDCYYDGVEVDTSTFSESDQALMNEIRDEAKADKADGEAFLKGFQANADNGYLPWK